MAWRATAAIAAADNYTDWVEAEARGNYNVTVTWRGTQDPAPDIIVESKLVDDEDSSRVTVSTIVPGAGNPTGMRTETLSGNRYYRVGVPSGETVSATLTVTVEV